MNTSCNGSRAHSAQTGTVVVPSGSSFSAMLRFAGNTATNSAIKPQAASLRVAGRIKPRPPRISATPEM